MIEIDKTDFLYNHLKKLGTENIDELYVEFASKGVINAKDFKDVLYREYGDDFSKEIADESIEELLPYYLDAKRVKKVAPSKITQLVKDYKASSNKEVFNLIVNSKIHDMMFVSALYKNKLPDIEIEDILQTCNLGLMKAIEKFDPKARISFDEYVEFWVAMEIRITFFKEKYDGKN